MASRSLSAPQALKGLQCCALLAVMLLGLLHFALPKMDYIALKQIPPGIEYPALFPDMNQRNGDFTYIIQLNYQPFQQAKFQLYPYGCIRRIVVNDIIVPFSLDLSCSFVKGMPIDFSSFLKPGDNRLTVEVEKSGLQMGPLVFDHELGLTDWIGYCLIIVSCLALILFLYRQTGEWLSGSVLSGAMLLCLYQFSQTGFMLYAIDMPQHLQYITFIANYGFLPNPYAGRMYYHPPLYYSIEALLLLFVHWLGSFDTVSALRLFSLSCYMAFLVFAALIMRGAISNRMAYGAALLLLAFYPSGIMFAARLDSNLLFYPLCAGTLYFTVRWVKEHQTRHAGLALIMFGLGLATRSNMLIIIPMLAIIGFWQWRCYRQAVIDKRSVMLWVGLATLLLGVCADFGRSIYYRMMYHKDGSLLISNINWLSPRLSIDNSPAKFLLPDMQSYLATPFWSAFHDEGGRQYFWNALLKSSLFGEFKWYAEGMAIALSFLLPVLILWTGIHAVSCLRDRKQRKKWAFFGLLLLVPILALMINRWSFPYACSQDFRYIYPALIGFCGMLGLVIERHLAQRQYLRAGSGILLVVIFSGYSITFFLIQ